MKFMLNRLRYPIRAEQTEIKSDTKTRAQLKLAKFELIQALACYCLSGICILSGVALLALGMTGEISLTVEHTGWTMSLINLSPGAFIFVVGIAFAWLGRYRFKHTT
ncbi:hypothetical protein B9Q17_05905 [Marinobacter vinifirmus]|uniref:Uncharacterized protein n=1 Tax=Marinobacter vinifirmus TaxID=355591 RepID=A0A7Z1DRJ0_9GAMM|nr:hypothetical protein [Marinobacter vinifirmus]OZC34548.1 hypothetical protein B9Q17_05905 [Marinobacter vinifirmus]